MDLATYLSERRDELEVILEVLAEEGITSVDMYDQYVDAAAEQIIYSFKDACHPNLAGHRIAGELLVGGEGLARGYYARAELTQEVLERELPLEHPLGVFLGLHGLVGVDDLFEVLYEPHDVAHAQDPGSQALGSERL